MAFEESQDSAQSHGMFAQDGKTPHPRILVAEDHDFIRQLLKAHLLRAGYEVDEVADGATAWDRIQSNRYDLLVTDNDMPHLTGVELIAKMSSAGVVIPVVMVTGMWPEEYVERPWLQPAALLFKPIAFERLLAAVEELLNASGRMNSEVAPSLRSK